MNELDQAFLPAGFRYLPHVLPLEEERRTFAALLADTPWETQRFNIMGRTMVMPRRIAMYGPMGYRYSSARHSPRPLTPLLEQLCELLEQAVGVRFNSTLLNLYRDGHDSVSWHSDDDYGHAANPTIGSLSLGATRRFQIRSKVVPRSSYAIDLVGGSVLVMEGQSQQLCNPAHG